eukprot:66344-Hanusia_phi.AAC.1
MNEEKRRGEREIQTMRIGSGKLQRAEGGEKERARRFYMSMESLGHSSSPTVRPRTVGSWVVPHAPDSQALRTRGKEKG